MLLKLKILLCAYKLSYRTLYNINLPKLASERNLMYRNWISNFIIFEFHYCIKSEKKLYKAVFCKS